MKEHLKFFKSSNYQRVFKELRKKWESYGKFAGAIKLDNLSEEEKKDLGSFLGKFIGEDSVKIKCSEFEEALVNSKFKNISLINLLEDYFDEKILTNSEKRSNKENMKKESFERVRKVLEEQRVKSRNIDFLLERIEKNYKYELEGIVINSLRAVEYLERKKEKIKLAILSNHITSNPHYFDRGSIAGNYLLQLLATLENIELPNDSEGVIELYFKYGIEGDTISSFTTAFGIKLYREENEHRAYSEFIKNGEPYLISLSNLKGIIGAKGVNKKVFIVENQMLFSYLCEVFKDKKVSLICTSGQFKTASLFLIDLLCKSDNEIYYSGDFDGEGLEMAQRILKRGEGKIKLWRYSIEDYKKTISHKELSELSLKKLDKIEEKDLVELVKVMRINKKSGYQESILEEIVMDIQKSI